MYKLVGNGKQYEIKAVGVRDERRLTKGKIYITLHGIEAGIFKDSPYVTVVDDDGRNLSCHASRFEIVKEVE